MNVAVILAAGLGSRFGDITKYVPKGMIKIGEKPMVEASIEKLLASGYSEVLIVTGHASEVYDHLAEKWDNVNTIKNPFYATSGSLFSLYLAMSELRKYRFNNLTILESDIIYDRRILEKLPSENMMVMSKPKEFGKDIGDECWIEFINDRISAVVKDPKTIYEPTYEIIGISNISLNTIEGVSQYEDMLALSLKMLAKTNFTDYETMLSATRNFKGLETHYDWAEMDNIKHMEYAVENILPNIQ